MLCFVLVNNPKLRLLLIPKQGSNLSEQDQLIHEMRIDKMNDRKTSTNYFIKHETNIGFYLTYIN
jgi:hypothetical protein